MSPITLDTIEHIPVLRRETLSILSPKPGETVLDVTLGLGGHSTEFLKAISSTARLIGLDADSANLRVAERKLRPWSDLIDLRHANFRDLQSLDLPAVDILFADLGLSSPHVDDPSRGFSFRDNGPLDLRFDQTQGGTAAGFLAHASAEDFERVFCEYGELPQARQLARKLYEAVRHSPAPIATTGKLREIIEDIAGWRAPKILPQVFQALRMHVNDELGALRALLATGPGLLTPGGRMGIISYHSLEDRLVKQVFRALSTPLIDDRTGSVAKPAGFRLLARKPIVPSPEEVTRNSRSRSAKLRVLAKL